jgi:hypothetical protein
MGKEYSRITRGPGLGSAKLDKSVKTTGKGDIAAETKGKVKRYSKADEDAYVKGALGTPPMKPRGIVRPAQMKAYRESLATYQSKEKQLRQQYRASVK